MSNITLQGAGLSLHVGGGVGPVCWYEEDGNRCVSSSDADDILIQSGQADMSFAAGLFGQTYLSHDLEGELTLADLPLVHLDGVDQTTILTDDWKTIPDAFRSALVTGSVTPLFGDDGSPRYDDGSSVLCLHTEEKGCWASFDVELPDGVSAIGDFVTGVIVGEPPGLRSHFVNEWGETPIFVLGLRTTAGDLICSVEDTEIKYSHAYFGQVSYCDDEEYVDFCD